MEVVSGPNYVNKPQYRTQNLKNELWGPKNVNKLGSFGNTGKGLIYSDKQPTLRVSLEFIYLFIVFLKQT